MAWAVPGSGGGALTVAGVPGVSVDGSGDAPGDGTTAGRVASFGAPTTLSVLDAASIRIMCWRSCSSRATDLLAGIPATTSAVGSLPPACARATWAAARAPAVPATRTAATSRNTPVRGRLRVLAGPAFRCRDNSVLPSASTRQAKCSACGPLRYRAPNRVTVRPECGEAARSFAGRTRQLPDPAPSAHHIARSGEVIRVIPNKSCAGVARLAFARITVWQYVMEQLPSVRHLIR